jgi:hypothetical protein
MVSSTGVSAGISSGSEVAAGRGVPVGGGVGSGESGESVGKVTAVGVFAGSSVGIVGVSASV